MTILLPNVNQTLREKNRHLVPTIHPEIYTASSAGFEPGNSKCGHLLDVEEQEKIAV